MNKYVKMFVFTLLLGTFASGIFIGADVLTAERIEANQEVDFRKTVLDVFDISYANNTINEVYLREVSVEKIDETTLYLANESVGYVVEGGGVWGPIIGFVALEEDFETIKKVDILQQEETPGLGGRIVEASFLDQFIEVKMIPSLEINKDTSENMANEVDTITGATRTSKAFELIMNTEYEIHQKAWQKLTQGEGK